MKLDSKSRDKSVYHYKRGTALAKKGENDQAILYFDKALEINPRFVEAYCNRGLVEIPSVLIIILTS